MSTPHHQRIAGAMADKARSQIIKDNPVGKVFDSLRASFNSICDDKRIPPTDALGQLGQEDLRNLTLLLLLSLQSLPIADRLYSKSGHGTLRADILRLIAAVASNDFDFDRVKPLLRTAVSESPRDTVFWDQVYHAVAESTPPPRPIASSFQQTPWLHNTSSFANSSEYRQDVDRVLKMELGSLYVGLTRFREIYFGRVAGLEAAAGAVFKDCMGGSTPLFDKGWTGWPKDANENDVLSWFADLCEKLAAFAERHGLNPACRRRPLARPNKAILGSIGERKLHVGFVNDTEADKDSQCHWSQVLVPGELKSKPIADTPSKAWLDLGTYARKVLAAQDTRRFALGFTICGSFMRIWEFDRLGGVASEQFDINENGLQFVSIVLGFLWMDEEQLGFDPTIVTAKNERFIEIERNGMTERVIIDGLMLRARCIAGRATTCWKAHREGYPQVPLVIKDSWQHPERDEEGEMLREVTDKGVVNVARYYHHETVQVCGTDDDIRSNVRGGLDITRATNYQPERSMPPPKTTMFGAWRKVYSNGIAAKKRSSSQAGAALPPSKRSCSSPTKASSEAIPNRVHRRVILRDYGKPIYTASSPSAVVAALEGCIKGHESLRKAGFLHRDISINNLMINEDVDNISWPSFLIDLDLAVREPRESASGAKGKTGTRAFMAIGALLGEHHSFMHDLESFFWVLFWLCIHHNGPDESRVVPRFDKWNYVDTEELAGMKLGVVAKETIFMKTITDNFAPSYQALIPLLGRLRKIVFPGGGPWEREDEGLYRRMRDVLQDELTLMAAASRSQSPDVACDTTTQQATSG